ncbi:hypothetical protein GIB67_018063 [Kingdonia uniflora]|uniref:BHLH domain-containing protein n=1 Tax=Kingdonia uniflora TaxID=39325 RepID=A0A7J7NWK3_9MAGN|nr:hypothetical protein GIB67_018063 [Kingdonia uniflora]
MQGQAQFSDFGHHDFINDGNFQQFIDLIRGENVLPVERYYDPNYDGELLFSGEFVDNNQFSLVQVPGEIFEFNSTSTTSDPNSILNSLPPFGEDFEGEGVENDGDDSSGTTTTKRVTGDRSRTLVSERKRRRSMKERLYTLRSLVPNITKVSFFSDPALYIIFLNYIVPNIGKILQMDKASIIGDAVSYLQKLQTQVKKLKVEITGLESSLKGETVGQQGIDENPKKSQLGESEYLCSKKIVQMDVFQVEDKEFCVRLVCEKGQGVAVLLFRALESLPSFDVLNSNFTTVSERSVLTFTINVGECGEEMNLPTLKLWLTGALLNQRFEFNTL